MTSNKFSSIVQLNDLNDFIGPGQVSLISVMLSEKQKRARKTSLLIVDVMKNY
jgi:hypothetical protein